MIIFKIKLTKVKYLSRIIIIFINIKIINGKESFMAKMVNPNTVSNMDLINAKSQAKMQQIVQKVGKVKCQEVI